MHKQIWKLVQISCLRGYWLQQNIEHNTIKNNAELVVNTIFVLN